MADIKDTERAEQEIRDQLNDITSESQKKWQEELRGTVEDLKPIPRKSFSSYLQGIYYGFLGLTNFYLFFAVITGPAGFLMGLAAACLESLAAWCKMNINRAKGAHREAMRQWGSILGFFAVGHAIIAGAHFSGYTNNYPWLNAAIGVYTHIGAFAAISVLLYLALGALEENH